MRHVARDNLGMVQMKRLTAAQEARAELLCIAAMLRPDGVPNYWGNALKLSRLESLGRILRKRFEVQCSYEWANTEKYEKRTETLITEAKTLFANLSGAGKRDLEVNRDPRGCALKIKIHDGIHAKEFAL